jgi:hypothetical protein
MEIGSGDFFRKACSAHQQVAKISIGSMFQNYTLKLIMRLLYFDNVRVRKLLDKLFTVVLGSSSVVNWKFFQDILTRRFVFSDKEDRRFIGTDFGDESIREIVNLSHIFA